MNTRDRSGGLRRKLFMLYHGDGLLDLAAGMTVLLLAAVFAFDAPAFIGLIGIPLILYIPLKDSLAVPRMGLIRFESGEISRRKLLGFLLSGAVVFHTIPAFESPAAGDRCTRCRRWSDPRGPCFHAPAGRIAGWRWLGAE